MSFPANKTKIVCTVGPASESPEILKKMILAGMNVARLNFSHGDFSRHEAMINTIREAALATGRRVAIMADLAGPKMRIGQLAQEPIELQAGRQITLTTDTISGDQDRISVSFARLPEVVKAGERLFINDGIIHLRVEKIQGNQVVCEVMVGGELRSRKGLNLPGIDLGISAFTEHDHRCLQFAMQQGVDAVSQSFVESDADIHAVRKAASQMDYQPFIIAKIERANALNHIDNILKAADGIMIARGDLGVEIPIEQIAVVQKQLMKKANIMGKPVITATQMLESMSVNRRPTRAEATDVANAILDGTDCVMLSGESAMGQYPVEAVEMLAQIAATIEPHRPAFAVQESLRAGVCGDNLSLKDLIALSVETTVRRITPAAVIVPTHGGGTARDITRFRLPVWITAISSQARTCQNLTFSYGVYPVHELDHPDDWKTFSRNWLQSQKVEGNLVVLTEGPSNKRPDRNNRMEIMDLSRSHSTPDF